MEIGAPAWVPIICFLCTAAATFGLAANGDLSRRATKTLAALAITMSGLPIIALASDLRAELATLQLEAIEETSTKPSEALTVEYSLLFDSYCTKNTVSLSKEESAQLDKLCNYLTDARDSLDGLKGAGYPSLAGRLPDAPKLTTEDLWTLTKAKNLSYVDAMRYSDSGRLVLDYESWVQDRQLLKQASSQGYPSNVSTALPIILAVGLGIQMGLIGRP